MPTEAEVLLSKIPQSRSFKTAHKVKISTEKALLSFLDYLDNLVKQNAKKYTSKSAPSLIPSIYRNKFVFSNETDFINYHRDTICIASTCFREVLERIYNGRSRINYNDIKPYQELIRAYIFDLKPHIEFLERKKDNNYQLFGGGKLYNIYPFEINKLSNTLYWELGFPQKELDQRIALNLSCFTIRQSLEIRFINALGISYLKDTSHSNIKLKHDFYPKFIKKNTDLFNLPDVSLSSLMKIYNWTNNSIHNGISPKTWQVHYALKYINTFFDSHEIQLENGKRTLHSLYGSIQIKNYPELQQRLKQAISIELEHNNFTIEFKEPEAVLLD
jgi:hypothetical protein